MKPIISIIVPVYNVEQYLERCVNSILSQTFTDFELYLVDDGSMDRSGKLCDEYAEKDSRIIVIHKKNGGLSDARNVALDCAIGEYICFIDSDDYVDSQMLEKTYLLIQKENADIVISNHFVQRENKILPFYNGQDYLILNSEEAIQLVLECTKCAAVAWGKLYKKYIFNQLRFPAGSVCEDGYVIVDVLSLAQKVIYDYHKYYYYVIRKGSISMAINYKREFDLIEAWKYNLNKIQQQYPSILKYAWFRYFAAINSVIYKMSQNRIVVHDEDISKIRNILIKNWKKIVFLPRISIKRKTLMFLFIASPNVQLAIECYRSSKNKKGMGEVC